MRYFYQRVSTKTQNLARQEAAADRVPDVDRVFSDKQSGKNFDRAAYKELKSVVRSGDEVFVKSLDRLGRSKVDMKKELDWFRENGVVVRVLDLPTTLIEFPVGQEWILDLVNNILVEVLSAVAEQERLTIEERRKEGVAAMPVVDGRRVSSKTGRGFGRPKASVDSEMFSRLAAGYAAKRLSAKDCYSQLGVGRSKWFELIKGVV